MLPATSSPFYFSTIFNLIISPFTLSLYFQNLFLSAAMVALLGLAGILGAVCVENKNKHWGGHTLRAGVVSLLT